MTVSFHRVMPQDLEYLGGDSIRYLDDAAKSVKNYFGANQAIIEAKNETGHIYQVFDGKKLMGCFFVNFVTNHLGICMTLVLLGGHHLMAWANNLREALYAIANAAKADEFAYLGRPGFARMFPELEYVATLYRKKLTPPI